MSSKTCGRIAAAVAVAAVVLSAALPVAAQTSKTPPRVVILATGGTIAGVQPKEGDPGYKSGSLSVESLIQAAPGVEKLAKLEGEQIASIGSQDMNDEVWLKLATRANALLREKDVAGIVVTHGTDTMEETAYFLNLVLKSEKPVVLVGSMRPATSTSPDGPLNLYNGVSVAADPDARGLGVMVVANDDLFSARGITKTNTTDVQTMVSPGRGQLGEAYYGENRIYNRPTEKNTAKSEFSLDGVKALPRVDIVYAAEGVDAVPVQAAVAAGARGIVLAGVGDGNATRAMIDALAAAAKQGVVVVRSTRVGTGFVRRNIELNDDQLGFVAAMDLNPQKARVLLRMALTKTADVTKIQKYFEEY